ncbi:hypothetical protein BpHYR1_050175 [Brachionus plicatilis]|uniref:Uncharacterized protein n=1 Tax=Brachionus plicatilis TaxID=10195 RepID=A0A3M7S132_BRAPC|nr:hypothetical protein BpHYR1_050175 [Brachionus plicatilis]
METYKNVLRKRKAPIITDFPDYDFIKIKIKESIRFEFMLDWLLNKIKYFGRITFLNFQFAMLENFNYLHHSDGKTTRSETNKKFIYINCLLFVVMRIRTQNIS